MKKDFHLEIWFDFASTYSYLSVMRIEALAAAHQIPIVWKPILLGPIFQQQGWNDSPFNVYPAKGRYMWRDMERRAAKYGVPFQKPSVFPRNGLLAARIGVLDESEPWRGRFVRRVFEANFAADREIGDAAVIADILQELGLDGEAIIGRAQEFDNKLALRTQTEQAQALGIFGAPTFVVGREIFWGDDRLEDALAYWIAYRFQIVELDQTADAADINRVMQAAYQVEAALLGVDDFFPLGRTAVQIAASPNQFFGCWRGSDLVGVCELEEMGDGRLLIASTVVDPAAFRQGVASRLLGHVLETHPDRPIIVSTAVANQPAVRLYQKHGFAVQEYKTLPDGMELVVLGYQVS